MLLWPVGPVPVSLGRPTVVVAAAAMHFDPFVVAVGWLPVAVGRLLECVAMRAICLGHPTLVCAAAQFAGVPYQFELVHCDNHYPIWFDSKTVPFGRADSC